MQNIKKIYLYLVSVISLFIIVFGAISLLNMGLKTWVFTKADKDFYAYPMCPVETTPDGSKGAMVNCDETQQRKQADENRIAQKQREAANSLAMIIVGAPVFYFHWRLARKEA